MIWLTVQNTKRTLDFNQHHQSGNQDLYQEDMKMKDAEYVMEEKEILIGRSSEIIRDTETGGPGVLQEITGKQIIVTDTDTIMRTGGETGIGGAGLTSLVTDMTRGRGGESLVTGWHILEILLSRST